MELKQRHVQLEGSSNFRDIGGYHTKGGQRVRWGQVYRSAALWGLTEADWAWMSAQGFAVLCDLRSEGERDIAPAKWTVSAPPREVAPSYNSEVLFARNSQAQSTGVGALAGSLYLSFARLLAPSLTGLFRALAAGETPAIVHCTAGQDRTGLAIAILLEVLGVERETIYADYLLSTELRRPEYELDRERLTALDTSNVVAAFYRDLIAELGMDAFRPRPLLDETGRPLLMNALSAIEQEWGSVEGYVTAELGVRPEDLSTLRIHLLEPA